MKKVAICGMGIVTEAGMTVEEIWDNIEKDKKHVCNKIDYSGLNAKKTRRMSEDAKMLVLSTANCLKDSQLSEELYHDCGIIVNVVYGPISTTLRFAKYVNDDEPNMASPIDFANTVNNAVVGHTAQYFGLQGPSTLLMGSNVLGYTANYINLRPNRDINIVVGGVEELNEVQSEYGENKLHVPYNKNAAVTLLLSNNMEGQYAYISGFAESGTSNNFLLGNTEINKEEAVGSFIKVIQTALTRAQVSVHDIDAIFCASPEGYIFDPYEQEAIKQIFDNPIKQFHLKDYVGELIAANMLLNAGVAAYSIKNKGYKHVLVLGYEVSGTMEAVVLSNE